MIHEFLRPPPPVRDLRREQEISAIAHLDRLLISPGVENAEEEILYYRWGAGNRRIMLLHGWGGKALQYFTFIQALVTAGCEVVAFDAPAHGGSSGTLASGPAFARVAREVARRVGQVHGLVGHSLGAAASAIAMHNGLGAGRVVFLAPLAFIFPLLEDFIQRKNVAATEADALRRVFRERYRADVLSVPEMATRFKAAALIFHDPADKDIPVQEAREIAAAWRGATLIEMRNVGHWRILRAAAVVDQSVAFLLE
ncbi:MAG: alpha/beta hydrolase [Chthoniobacterales bacterium]